MHSVYLNIGSNRGQRQALISAAVGRVAALYPQAVLRLSPWVESRACGYESAHGFLNIGVALDFGDSDALPQPEDMLHNLQAIERDMAPESPHRNADGSYRDRELDIDIIDFDGMVVETEELTLPHPRAEARAFVMEPMEFLCPGWHPDRVRGARRKKSIADMHRDTVAEFKLRAKTPLVMVLDNVRSLNNVGSVFRSADAFALEGVVLCGITACPPDPQIHKTALGAEESVDWRHFDSTLQAVATLRAEGYTVCSLEQVHGSVALQDVKLRDGEKIALIAGNEVNGVDPAVVDASDYCIEIPQSGTKHSLNVAVSSAVAMWQIYQQTV